MESGWKSFTQWASVVAYVIPGSLLLLTSFLLFLWNGNVFNLNTLWFPEALFVLGLLFVITGRLGWLAARGESQREFSMFAGSCLALSAVEVGLWVIFLCQRDELAGISLKQEPTSGLRKCLGWIDKHPLATAYIVFFFTFVQVLSVITIFVVRLHIWLEPEDDDEEHLREELEDPLLPENAIVDDWKKAYKVDVDKQAANARRNVSRPCSHIAMTMLFAYMATLGFMFLVATAVLSGGDRSAPSGEGGDASLLAPGSVILEHHGHHHRHMDHGNANSSASSGGLLWYPGTLAVMGAPLFVTGGVAAMGAWSGGVGAVRCFAGAGSILLASQIFFSHMYFEHRELLYTAAGYDESNGLQTTLEWGDDHPLGALVATAAFLALQLFAVLAAGVYGVDLQSIDLSASARDSYRSFRTNVSSWRTATAETSFREWLTTWFSRDSGELEDEGASLDEEAPEHPVLADPWAGMPRAGPEPGAAVQWRSIDPVNPHGAWIGSRAGPRRAASSEIRPEIRP